MGCAVLKYRMGLPGCELQQHRRRLHEAGLSLSLSMSQCLNVSMSNRVFLSLCVALSLCLSENATAKDKGIFFFLIAL